MQCKLLQDLFVVQSVLLNPDLFFVMQVSAFVAKRSVQALNSARFEMEPATTLERDIPSFRLPAGLASFVPELMNASSTDSVDVSSWFVAKAPAQGDRTLVTGTYALTLWLSSAYEPLPVKHLPDGKEILVTIPFDTSSLPTDTDRSRFLDGTAECLHWIGGDRSENPLDMGSMWSPLGCRVQSISRGLSDAGVLLNDRGAVTCACTHLTTFAVSYGLPRWRFVEPTPRNGDVFQAEAGVPIAFTVRAETERVGRLVLEIQRLEELEPSFSLPALTAVIQSRCISTVQGMCVLNATESVFTWTPAQSGDYSMAILLKIGGIVADRRTVHLRVLFCEYFMTQRQTLREVAALYQTSWQALFTINPQIPNPRRVKAEAAGRPWLCDSSSGCSLATGSDSAGVRVNVGKVVLVAENQTITDLVAATGSSLTQLVKHNHGRLMTIGDSGDVFDLVPPGQMRSKDYNISYAGVELCLISSMADGCYLN